MSQKVVVAEYYAPEAVFKIPKGIDLEDKNQVKDWYVRWNSRKGNTLYIKFVDKKEEQEITASYESEIDYKRPAKATIMEREERECCLSSDDENEEE